MPSYEFNTVMFGTRAYKHDVVLDKNSQLNVANTALNLRWILSLA